MENGHIFVGSAICGVILGLILGILITTGIDADHWREEAIKHAAAEWKIVNPKTGETKFEWRNK